MNWYYFVDGEKMGPVSGEELQSLVKSGTIKSKTLVWNTTMNDRQPFDEIYDSFGKGTAQNVIAGTLTAACAECGRTFPKEEMVQYDNAHVCEACKPVFVQKIKEGVTVGGLQYAGFWIRFGAKFIDGIIVSIVNMVFKFFVLMGIAMMLPTEQRAMGVVIVILLQLTIAATYATWFMGKFAATPGKMACGLKVITADNEKVSYSRALGRHFSEFLSGIIFAIGYLMVTWDPEKRALHDRICNTRVIKK